MTGRLRTSLIAILVWSIVAGCGEEARQLGDVIPPAPITDLVVGRPLGNTITVAWTTTGDDSVFGAASFYDLRFAESPITEQTWPQATPVTPAPQPFSPGIFQGHQVHGLKPSTMYYFAVRIGDEVRNWSSLSNVGSGLTAGYTDSIPPAAVSDLTVDSTSTTTISISWTAPGDDSLDGMASVFDARFGVTPIVSDAEWTFSARLAGEPFPAPPGTHQSMTITGLSPGVQYYFALRAGDEIINWSPVSPQVSTRTVAAEKIPPHAVMDLVAGSVSFSSVELVWTAPGDDDTVGSAVAYDIRYNFYPITEESWEACSYVLNEPAPAPGGTTQSMTVSRLNPYRIYFFAMKTVDEIPNWSALSNVLTFTTGGGGGEDLIAPSRISDLAVVAASGEAVTLRWSSPGDDDRDGYASTYDIRYATEPITQETWPAATQLENEIPPHVSGTTQLMDVVGLQPNTTYYFAMITGDEIPNWSAMSNVASGRTKS